MDLKDLEAIWRKIVGPRPTLYLPHKPEQSLRLRTGARFIIVVGRRDLPEPPTDAEFWNRLNELPMPAGISALSALNLLSSRLDFQSNQHGLLHAHFLTRAFSRRNAT